MPNSQNVDPTRCFHISFKHIHGNNNNNNNNNNVIVRRLFLSFTYTHTHVNLFKKRPSLTNMI